MQMSLKEQIDSDIKNAMKNGEKQKLSVLRFLKAKIKDREINSRCTLQDDGIVAEISKQIKQLDDAIASALKASREDLCARNREEKEILLRYLPRQMSEEEVREALSAIIADENISGRKDFGKLMKSARAKLKAQADGRVINTIARELLD